MKKELLIKWETGETTLTDCESQEHAEQIEKGYKRAFGKQIAFSCIRDKKER